MDRYTGAIDNNYVRFTLYYGYTAEGKQYRDHIDYYLNGDRNKPNYTDWYKNDAFDSRLYYKYDADGNRCRDRWVYCRNGDLNNVVRVIYFTRLPDGSDNYDKIVCYNADGKTIDYTDKYTYDANSRQTKMDRYTGAIDNNYVRFTLYYGYTAEGKQYRDHIDYYLNGDVNVINYTDYYDKNDNFIRREYKQKADTETESKAQMLDLKTQQMITPKGVVMTGEMAQQAGSDKVEQKKQ
jgi:hypothetical protein